MTPTKGELRRTELLDAAERRLVTAGHAATSLRDVAETAGVRIGHLQHYFPTRSDLIRAVLERVLRRSLDRLHEASGIDVAATVSIADEPVSAAEVDAVITALLAEHDDPDTVRLYFEVWAIAAADDDVAEVVRDFYDNYLRHAGALVERAVPGLRAETVRAKAYAIVSLLEGAAVMRGRFVRNRPSETDTELRLAVRALLTRAG